MSRKHIDKIPSRKVDSHQGDFGRVLVVAGSEGMTGAAYLASQGALRAGSGLVVNAIPGSLNEIMEIKLTEAMTLPLPETKNGAIGRSALKVILDYSKKCDAVAVGPGLGTKTETQTLIREIIKRIACPLVIDADAINAIAGKSNLLKRRNNLTVITPHPGEMARLIKKDVSFVQLQRVETAKKVAKETGTVVCLKGHRTVVASHDGQIFVNETGNSGMATGGVGDVLTGMIASFIGQGIDLFGSSVSAVYLHGLAGDIASDKKGPFSMLATDVLEYLPQAFDKAGLV